MLLFNSIPLWGIFFGTIIIVLLSIELGFRVGRHRRHKIAQEKEAPIGAMVAATLGLLGFLLAFTFGLAANRFDLRRQLLLDETNAIGTTYLRADFFPEADRAELRRLLRDYVSVRLRAAQVTEVQEVISTSEAMHKKMWAQAAQAVKKEPNSVALGLFIQSLNETIDLHSKRVSAALKIRIPEIIWIVLYSITILVMLGVGYQSGLSGTRSQIGSLMLGLSFSAVMFLIVDLDRPGQGFLKISQQPMLELYNSIKEDSPK